MTVRIQHNIGEILGVDNRVYHLDEQDVVTLPETNAKTLINNEAATEIEQPENSK
jgi:DNA replication initiation complex subunit (GINS family)